jgi:hypothetical protein
VFLVLLRFDSEVSVFLSVLKLYARIRALWTRYIEFPEEACRLVEAGFEYVCDFNGNKIFRKRK